MMKILIKDPLLINDYDDNYDNKDSLLINDNDNNDDDKDPLLIVDDDDDDKNDNHHANGDDVQSSK